MKAREFALLQLDAKHLPGWPNDVFKQHLAPADCPEDPRDVSLAENITVGVIKNLFFLQYLIGHYSQRNVSTVDPAVQKIIALAIYQLRFLSRVPPSAAVHQAVEQAKNFGKPKAAGFVNAVLRRAAREPEVPLPDRENDSAAYAEVALSHPRGLFERFTELMGREQALLLCEKNNDEPPTIVRLNRGVTIEALAAPNLHIIPHEQDGLVVVDGARQSAMAAWAEKGLAQVQDATSAKVIDFCDVHPGHTVLDRCCGLGTKTLQLQERVGESGQVIAIDPSASRTKTLLQTIAKHGIRNVAVVQTPAVKNLLPELLRPFERALVDVPCSNSGVLARRAEARFHQDSKSMASLDQLQAEILDDTAPHIAPGGRLIYSTCSIWPEENEKRIESFLKNHADFRLVEQHATLPSLDPDPARYHDGGYVAVLKRSA